MSAWGAAWGGAFGASFGAIDVSAGASASKTQGSYRIGGDDSAPTTFIEDQNRGLITLLIGLAAAGAFE